MEDWSAIAAEVDEAIRSVADVAQPGGFPATLRRMGSSTGDPWDPQPGQPTYLTVFVIEEFRQLRNADGTMIDRTIHRLTCSAQPDIVPSDEDQIAIGIEAGSVNAATEWLEISEVRPLSPAGIAVLYEIDLQS